MYIGMLVDILLETHDVRNIPKKEEVLTYIGKYDMVRYLPTRLQDEIGCNKNSMVPVIYALDE